MAPFDEEIPYDLQNSQIVELGKISLDYQTDTIDYVGDKLFLAIYDECAKTELVGAGLFAHKLVLNQPLRLVTAELTREDAIALCELNGESVCSEWLEMTEGTDVSTHRVGKRALCVRNESGKFQVFGATPEGSGTIEVWLQTDVDLQKKFNRIPRDDLAFLSECSVGGFRRTEPNWTFVRIA
jgi:hypothetical protein